MQIISLPNYHIGKSISDGLFSIGGSLISDSRKIEFLQLYDKSVLVTMILSAAIYGIAFLLIEHIVVLLLPLEWWGSINIMKYLCIWMALALAAAPSMRAYLIIGKPWVKFVIDLLTLLSVISISYWSYIAQYGFEFYLSAIVVARSIGYVLYIASARYLISRYSYD